MRRNSAVFLLAALCLLPASAVGGVLYVNVNTGSDASNNCRTHTSPCKTINRAMQMAAESTLTIVDTINVANGVYGVASGESFPIVFKAGVSLVASAGDHGAIIDASGANARVFSMVSTPTAIDGFVIRGGRHAPASGVAMGGAIFMQFFNGGPVTLTRNLFVDNRAIGFSGATFGGAGGHAYGGAIGVDVCNGCNVFLDNSVFTDNAAIGGRGGSLLVGGTGGNATGGAVYMSAGNVTYCTFYGNQAIAGNAGVGSESTGLGGYASAGALSTLAANVRDSIFAANAVVAGSGQPSGAATSSAASIGGTPLNLLFWKNSVNGVANADYSPMGFGSLLGDPLFHHAPDDLHLGLASPARGSGSECDGCNDFDGFARPIATSRGAFEAYAYDEALTDLNVDFRSDLLWRNGATGQVYRMLMDGFAVLQAGVVYVEPNLHWKIVADADFNGDAISDLLWRNSATGQVYLMRFNANGLPAAGNVIYNEVDAAWRIVHTPDLDGNGHADLLWWNSLTGQVFAMLLQDGARIGEAVIYTEPNTSWRIAATGDFVGNGKQNQLLWRNGVTGEVFLMSVTYANGGFSVAGSLIYREPNLSWKIVAAADYSGDGRSDILWHNDATGQVYVLTLTLGTGTVNEGALVYQEPDPSWYIAAIGDYNGDGRADILWRNTATGQVYMLLLNVFPLAGAVVYTEPDANWKLLGVREYSQ